MAKAGVLEYEGVPVLGGQAFPGTVVRSVGGDPPVAVSVAALADGGLRVACLWPLSQTEVVVPAAGLAAAFPARRLPRPDSPLDRLAADLAAAEARVAALEERLAGGCDTAPAEAAVAAACGPGGGGADEAAVAEVLAWLRGAAPARVAAWREALARLDAGRDAA